MKKIKISHSALESYHQCPQKYYLKHVLYIKPFVPVRWSLVTGVAFHKLMDHMYQTCNFDLKFLIREWKKIFLDSLEEEGSAFSDTKGHEKYLAYGYGVVKKFHTFALDNGYLVKPIKSEWKFTEEVNGTIVTGVVDLVIQKKIGLPIEILDFKTGWKLPTKEDVDKNKQLTIYDWAVKKVLGISDTIVGLLFPRKSCIISGVRTEADHQLVLDEFINLDKNIKESHFEPNYLHCKDCEFKGNCKFIAKTNIEK
jgi:ATP-dependent helicase/DNAse subunit B